MAEFSVFKVETGLPHDRAVTKEPCLIFHLGGVHVGFVDVVNIVHDIKYAVFLIIATDETGNFLQVLMTIAHGNSVAGGCYHGHIVELIAHGTGVFGFYAQVFV